MSHLKNHLSEWGIVLVFTISGFAPSELLAQQEKISPQLKERMGQVAPDEFIPVVIFLGEQLSVIELEQLAQDKVKLERREVVISYLRDFAKNRQAGLLQELNERQKQGAVRDVLALWITNAVVAKLKPAVVEALAQRPDVSSLVLDQASPAMGANTWNVEKIQAHMVWPAPLGYTGSGVLIAILDTGIDYTHTDLRPNMWQNLGEDADQDGRTLEFVNNVWQLDPGDLNGSDDDSNGRADDLVGYDFNNLDRDPMDDHDHGTHVSGTAAGNGAGGTQTGVAPGARLMALKIWDYTGWGTPSQCWQAFEYAVANGADVINLSGGWRDSWITLQEKATFRQVCDNAVAAGVVVVTIVHNDGGGPDPVPHNVRTPGSVPSAISLGATDINDVIASFSSRGPVTWQDVPGYYDYPYPPGLVKPDVCAPGVNITSTRRAGGYVGGWNGTSMAAPAARGFL